MTDHALRTARIVPRQRPRSARRLAIANRVATIEARPVNERRLGLVVVPQIGVAFPLPLLSDQESCLDAPARRGIAGLAVERERLDEHAAVGEVPAARGDV